MIRRSNLTFSSAHFENTNRKHVADSSSISRNFKRRGTQNARTNEIQRERERVTRESIAPRLHGKRIVGSGALPSGSRTWPRLPRDLDRPHGKWELEPIPVAPPRAFSSSLLESLRAEIAFRLSVRN